MWVNCKRDKANVNEIRSLYFSTQNAILAKEKNSSRECEIFDGEEIKDVNKNYASEA